MPIYAKIREKLKLKRYIKKYKKEAKIKYKRCAEDLILVSGEAMFLIRILTLQNSDVDPTHLLATPVNKNNFL